MNKVLSLVLTGLLMSFVTVSPSSAAMEKDIVDTAVSAGQFKTSR